jgi:hypothetical protein
MSYRLVLSELRIMIEHLTTAPEPDPEFMRLHVSALSSIVETWAEEVEDKDSPEAAAKRARLRNIS